MEDKVKLIGGNLAVWFEDKGYGFLKGEDGQSYFVHIRTLQRGNVYEPAIGDKFLFSVTKSPRRANSFEAGPHIERLGADGSRAPRPARPVTLQEAAKQEAKAFAQMAFLSKAPR